MTKEKLIDVNDIFESPKGFLLAGFVGFSYSFDERVLKGLIGDEEKIADLDYFLVLAQNIRMKRDGLSIGNFCEINPKNYSFHPKLYFIKFRNSKKKEIIRVVTGSVNMSLAGLNKNYELAYQIESEPKTKKNRKNKNSGGDNFKLELIRFIEYLCEEYRGCLSKEKINILFRLRNEIKYAVISVKNTKFICTKKNMSIYNQIFDKFKEEDIETIRVLSPFWSVKSIKQITEQYKSSEGDKVKFYCNRYGQNSISFPKGKEFKYISEDKNIFVDLNPKEELCDEESFDKAGVQIGESEEITVRRAGPNHAKAILFEFKRKNKKVLFLGSVNFTNPALGLANYRNMPNIECGVLIEEIPFDKRILFEEQNNSKIRNKKPRYPKPYFSNLAECEGIGEVDHKDTEEDKLSKLSLRFKNIRASLKIRPWKLKRIGDKEYIQSKATFTGGELLKESETCFLKLENETKSLKKKGKIIRGIKKIPLKIPLEKNNFERFLIIVAKLNGYKDEFTAQIPINLEYGDDVEHIIKHYLNDRSLESLLDERLRIKMRKGKKPYDQSRGQYETGGERFPFQGLMIKLLAYKTEYPDEGNKKAKNAFLFVKDLVDLWKDNKECNAAMLKYNLDYLEIASILHFCHKKLENMFGNVPKSAKEIKQKDREILFTELTRLNKRLMNKWKKAKKKKRS